MGFFTRAGEEDAERAASLAAVESGGIPAEATARLRELGVDGSLFTSGLSVSEFALLDRLAARPVAQVMGASVVRTGWQYLPALEPGLTSYGYTGGPYGPTVTGRALSSRYTEPSWAQVRSYQWHTDVVCELDTLTDAWNLATRRALDRLAEEAAQVGADAVVGVRLTRSERDAGRGTIECVVTGTAIRVSGSAGAAWPLLTDVSVQDYWRLRSAGHDPVGLVATSLVVFASAARATRLQRRRALTQNFPIDELTRAFQDARETVRNHMRGQVADFGGTGAVGVEISHAAHREKFTLASSLAGGVQRGWHRGALGIPYKLTGRGDAERSGWVITMHAAGTAVRRRQLPTAAPAVKPALRMGRP